MQTGRHNGHQEHVASYYAATRNDHQQWPELSGELDADVCIIGGGFTGLNTAINLAEAGYKVVLLEANRIGWGASGRNGGQLIRGIGHDTSQFARWIGEQGVRELDLMGLEAVQLVRERVARFNIDCDLTWGYCDLATKPRHLKGFEEDAEHLASLGYSHELKLVPKGEIRSVVGSDRYIGGMIDMGSGHLHPLNLALGEAAAAQQLGVQLFEQSNVTRIDYGPEVKVHTANGTVHANTAADVPALLEALAALGGIERAALHSQLAGAVRVVLHVRRRGAQRELAEIALLGRGSDGWVSAQPAVIAGRPQEPGAARLAALLAERGQMLAFEPPHFGPGATVGGCIAAGLAGPVGLVCAALGVLAALTSISAMGVPYLSGAVFSGDGVVRRNYRALSRRPFTIWQRRGS